MMRTAALTLPTVLALLLAACGDAPPPTPDPTALRAPAVLPEAPKADVVVTLQPDGGSIRVFFGAEDCGPSGDGATWKTVEERLTAWVTAHPDHAKPSVRVDAPPGVETEDIVGAVNTVMAIGVEQVSLHRTRAAE